MRPAMKLYRAREVIEITGLSRRTLRIYEEVGLVAPADPSSSEGEESGPFYTEDVVETLRRIERLRRDLGVNLPGVQVILEMRQKIIDLQTSLDEVVRFVHTDLRQELEQFLRREEKAVVPKPLFQPPKPWED
ncbi:MAG: MerR family transcriptional regulator [Deferrisomatales bacterium]|nr:MerR family transcriptional regulator [Deferrisomatales bacterium]